MNKELNPAEITQYYVTERNGNGHFFYSLYARDHNNMEIEIIPLVKDLQIVLFAEQELEDFYDIQDVKVDEELRT